MATLSRGQTYGATETITNTKLHNLVDLGSVSAIVNADIDSAAAIADTKLADITTGNKVRGTALGNLASIPSSAGEVPLANIPNDLTDLTNITSTNINVTVLASIASLKNEALSVSSLASFNQANFSTLKLGTTNQGDILYDNGTKIERLLPGISGQFLQTKGVGANPQWVEGGKGNIVFEYHGVVDSQNNYSGTSLNPNSPTGEYTFISVLSGTYVDILQSQFKKISSISQVTIAARMWDRVGISITEGTLKIDIGGVNTTLVATSYATTPTWQPTATLDVSSLSDGTIYDITISLLGDDPSTDVYVSDIIIFGG